MTSPRIFDQLGERALGAQLCNLPERWELVELLRGPFIGEPLLFAAGLELVSGAL